MTGTVIDLLGRPQTMCHISGTNGQTYWAHRKHFVNPSEMIVGTEVEFLVAASRDDGLLPVALEVRAIHKLAA